MCESRSKRGVGECGVVRERGRERGRGREKNRGKERREVVGGVYNFK